MAQLLDGKVVADEVYKKLLLDISLLGKIPKIVLLIMGEDPASQSYVRMKNKKCEDLGILGETRELSRNTAEDVLLLEIDKLNSDSSVHGILIQLPLPDGISKLKVMKRISPEKDVDGFHPENAGLLWQNQPRFVPCTPLGILEMLRHYKIPMSGKRAVVLGRSDIVGKPMQQLLTMQDATVTLCHSKTENIQSICREAEIVVVAMGRPGIVTGDWIRTGAVVVDVGIHRIDGKIIGDVDAISVSPKASYLSPVPGGVGPMTIAMLMRNVVEAAKVQKNKK